MKNTRWISFLMICLLALSLMGSAMAEPMTADVVVVGGGTSGLNAAVFAAKHGASVILTEKLSFLGGNGLLSSGALFTCNSEGIIDGDDSMEHALGFWRETAALAKDSGYPDWDRLEYTLEKTGETARQLVDLGVVFARGMSVPAGSYAISDGAGAGYIAALKTAVEEAGVQILLESPATSLIQDGDTVVGVKVSGKNGEQEIYAKTVILACGGFGRSPEMIAEYVPEATFVYDGRNVVSATGDGIRMAMEVGAVMYENPWLMVSTTMPDAEYNRFAKANSVLSMANGLAVSPEGNRFCNENATSYSAFGNAMIFGGYDRCYVLMNATDATLETLAKGVEMGQAFHADSVAALAEQIGVNADTLGETVARYQSLCEAQEDADFGKAAANLVKLDEGDLYAVLYYATSIGTMSGVKTNYDNEVLREDGSVIEGLLAIGEMSNREFYNYHYVGGASLGLYSTMGRLAGEYAAARAAE